MERHRPKVLRYRRDRRVKTCNAYGLVFFCPFLPFSAVPVAFPAGCCWIRRPFGRSLTLVLFCPHLLPLTPPEAWCRFSFPASFFSTNHWVPTSVSGSFADPPPLVPCFYTLYLVISIFHRYYCSRNVFHCFDVIFTKPFIHK